MELGTLQIQIFVSLVVVLGTAFVAFLCDFLKGNNEQLRERNIEMRVRQDERERWGVVHPGSLLKSIEALVRNASGIPVAPAEEAVPASSPAEPETQQPATWEQPIMAPAARGSAWASKEELEKLAERAARIRERHEARKATGDDLTEEEESAVEEPLVLASVTEMPSEGLAVAASETIDEPIAETAEDGAVAEETVTAEVSPVIAEAAFESLVEPVAESPALAEPIAEPVAEPIPDFVAEPLAEALSEAAQETPPPLMAGEVDTQASADAEATPVLEPVSIEPAELEVVAEIEPDEPASHIELQPLAVSQMPSFEPPPAGQVAHGDEPAAIAPGPELVMKPMGTATIIPSEPEELLEQESEASEGEFEPELLRVRVVPIDQSGPGVEEIIDSIVEANPEPLAEAAVEVQAPEVVSVVEEPAQTEPEQLETVSTNVADLENAAGIGCLHESLVAEEAGLPRGLHTAEVLREQIKANVPFQGVAVSIGINDYEALKQKLDTQGGADSLASIDKMIRGMLKEPDFACRFQDDEFILLFPGEADSAAQRRLFQISEKLWDFQLRSLGHHSIMFSWGGLEVKRDSLSDAVSAARERMFQTKRNRTGAIEMRKRVVNG